MAIDWEKEYSPSQISTNKSKINWDKEYKPVEYQKNIDTQRADRISKGLPVAINKEKVEPTLVGNIIRGAIMPFADVAKNILGGTNLDNQFLGKVKGLGKIDITKSPLQKDNLEILKRSALTGLEIGSYASGGGAVVNTGKNAVKQTAKEFLKTSGKQLVKEGAITSGLGSIGYQGREGKIDPLQVVRDTAIGAIAAPVLGTGFNKLFGKGITKETPKIINPIVNKVDEIADNSLSKSTTGIKQGTTKFLKENPQEIVNREVRLREVDGKVVIEDGRHTLQAAKDLGVEPKFVDVTPEYTGNKSNIIDSIISKGQKTATIQPEIERIIPEQTKSNFQIPEQIINKDVSNLTNDIEGFNEGTFKQWSSDIRNLDIEEVKRVAMGGEKTTQNNIPKNAYLSVMKNIANETKDIKLAQELATSNVSSKGGQELVASKLAIGDNIVDDLVEIKKSILKKKGMSVDKLATEEQVLLTKIKSKIKEMTNTIPTKQEFDNIINSLVCK